MDVMESGMTMLVRLLQMENALSPMEVTGRPLYSEGMTTSVSVQLLMLATV